MQDERVQNLVREYKSYTIWRVVKNNELTHIIVRGSPGEFIQWRYIGADRIRKLYPKTIFIALCTLIAAHGFYAAGKINRLTRSCEYWKERRGDAEEGRTRATQEREKLNKQLLKIQRAAAMDNPDMNYIQRKSYAHKANVPPAQKRFPGDLIPGI